MKFFLLLLLCLSLSRWAQAQQLTEKDVPAAVKAVATSKNGGVPPNTWLLDKRRSRYLATYIKKDPPTFRSVFVSLDGKWMETSEMIGQEKLPTAVTNALKTSYLSKGYKVRNTGYTQSATEGNFYVMEVTSEDNPTLALRYDAAGKLLKKTVQ